MRMLYLGIFHIFKILHYINGINEIIYDKVNGFLFDLKDIKNPITPIIDKINARIIKNE